MRRFTCLVLYMLIALFLVSSVSAATLTGTIYDLNLDTVDDVIIEINTNPTQRYLADSNYSLDIPEGKYILVAKKGNLITKEEIKISGSGTFVFDLFLFPSFDDEDEILSDIGGLSVDEKEGFSKYPWWSYAIALGIFVFLIIRVIKARKKYGPLRKKKEKVEDVPKEEKASETPKAEEKPEEQKEETNKESTEEKEEQEEQSSSSESDQVEKTLEIIKQNDGRITQKELRKEMMHLSEAKISLIITELEHKGKVEKIKKGRGNVVILK
ncbi:helix-turn-helix transcriptional regulator [Nanoarchaeota archaeon]